MVNTSPEAREAAIEPCPLCKSTNVMMQEDHWRDGNLRGGEPFCTQCGVKVPRYWPRRKQGAVETWNTRHRETTERQTPDTTLRAENEALVEALERILVGVNGHLRPSDKGYIDRRGVRNIAGAAIAAYRERQ